ncbi:TlpA family protein disulfide reductase [Candidatus Palauibacter sp.]|uniref:TlpA family protein disulfide reductase n=1 Tax=Candidatus Palauibacter sp. TaxID=3101350 RepID=UPI003D0CF39E
MLTGRGAVALLALAGYGCGPGGDAADGGAADGGAAVSYTDAVPSGAKPAPEDVFRTLEGGEASFPDLRGNVVVANLWGTWCLPCRDELPELVELARIYDGRPVVMLGLAVDSGDVDEIRAFLEEFGVEYPNWMMGMDDAVGTFGAVGFPTTVIVDQEGWIRKELLGPQTAASLTAEIEALLR